MLRIDNPRLSYLHPYDEFSPVSGAEFDWSTMAPFTLDVNIGRSKSNKGSNKSENDKDPEEHSSTHTCAICKHGAGLTKGRLTHSQKRGFEWDHEDDLSYSLSSRDSLSAKPLPDPPPKKSLPCSLIRTLNEHPDLFKVVTPIDITKFEAYLVDHPNQLFVRSVVNGLRQGFWPFAKKVHDLTVNCPSPSPKNADHRKFLQEYVKKEIGAERFSRSFDRLLPGMTCMPVHVKCGKKLRLIQDHSAGMHSLNSLIDEGDRTVQYDGIRTLGVALRRAHTATSGADIVVFKSDISQAYRIIPMHPFWQPLQAAKINGKYYIDRCNVFGNAASQRLFCAFNSLVLWIAENKKGIKDVLSYVDDNYSWEYQSKRLYYKPYQISLPEKQARLLLLWDELGIPHEKRKQEFGAVLSIIGYEIDTKRMQVSLSRSTINEIHEKINEICNRAQTQCGRSTTNLIRLRDLAMLVGTVNRVLDISPLLELGMASTFKEMSGKSKQSDPCNITDDIRRDLTWLSIHLKHVKGRNFFTPIWDPSNASLLIYTGASHKGFYWAIGAKVYYYTSVEINLPHEEINNEVIAVACAMHWAEKSEELAFPPRRCWIYCDSQAVESLFHNFRANKKTTRLLQSIVDVLLRRSIELNVSQKHGNMIRCPLVNGDEARLPRDYPQTRVFYCELPPYIRTYTEAKS